MEYEGSSMNKRNLWRKWYIFLMGSCLVMGLLAGCQKEKQTSLKTRQTLTLWHYMDSPARKQALSDIADAFNDSQADIEVEIQYVPDEDFKKHLALSMADGDMPELALVDSSDLNYFNAMQPFVNVTDQIENLDEYLPEAIASCKVDGQMKGMPLGMNCTALFCNTEILEEAGLQVPKTWDELQETALKLTKDNRYGFAMPALRSEESVFSFLPLLWGYGGEIAEIESEESQAAFLKLRELSESGAMSPQVNNLITGDIVRQFMEGNVVMVLVTSAFQQTIQKEKPNMKYVMTLPPSGNENKECVTAIGGEVLVVTPGEKQDEALEFVKFVSEKCQMEKLLEQIGYLAPREDILQEQIAENEDLKNTWQIMQQARLREFSVDWPYVSVALTDAMEEEIVGEIPQSVIISNLAEKLRKNREAK